MLCSVNFAIAMGGFVINASNFIVKKKSKRLFLIYNAVYA
jgi:hypothetical protein